MLKKLLLIYYGNSLSFLSLFISLLVSVKEKIEWYPHFIKHTRYFLQQNLHTATSDVTRRRKIMRRLLHENARKRGIFRAS